MYGFNLGQIEGLDSSVQTVTATIANATESNTYTLTYDDNNGNWTDDIDNGSMRLYYIDENVFGLEIANFTESDVGDTYNVTISTSAVEENFKSAVETVLVDNGLISAPETLFDGTITITAEDAQGVEIPFDKDVSSYPFEKWTVTINGLEIPYQADRNGFMLDVDGIGYGVFHSDGVYTLQVANIQDENYPPVPGNYQVKITGVSASGTNLPPIDTSTSYGNYYINVNRVGEIAYQEVQLSRITPSSADKIYIPACVGGVVDYLNDINGIDVSIMYSPCAYMLTYSASASPSWQLHSINVPTTAGNYVLKATVASGGTVSFSFVSE